jgi:hypothetical protein
MAGEPLGSLGQQAAAAILANDELERKGRGFVGSVAPVVKQLVVIAGPVGIGAVGFGFLFDQLYQTSSMASAGAPPVVARA